MENKNIHNENDVFLAKWMANEITDNDLKKLISEKDYVAYKKIKEGILLYEKLEVLNDNSFIEIQNRIKIKKERKIRSIYSKWAVSIAACVLLFVAMTTFFKNQTVLQKTNFGEQKSITLLDGSKVVLGPKAIIKYQKDNWENTRELHLDGEAFFNVKKGSTFTVKTKNGDIQVLGTQFNVNSKDLFFEVICYSGKVKVTNQNEEYILTPNQGFRKIENKVTERLQVKSDTPTWIFGEKSYKSIPIKYVIIDLESQFNIEFDSSKINNELLFTGFFEYKNKKLALKTVFNAMNIEYKETGTNHILLSPKKI